MGWTAGYDIRGMSAGGLARGVGHLAPVWAGRVRRGWQVKCAAGVGGDGDRIGGERVSRHFDYTPSFSETGGAFAPIGFFGGMW